MRSHAPDHTGRPRTSSIIALAVAASVLTSPVVAKAQGQGRTQAVPSDALYRWKAQLMDAEARRQEAVRMERTGFFLALAADVAAGIIENSSCSGFGSHCAAPVLTVGLVGAAVGLPIGFVGKARAHKAEADIALLNRRGPDTSAGVALRLRW